MSRSLCSAEGDCSFARVPLQSLASAYFIHAVCHMVRVSTFLVAAQVDPSGAYFGWKATAIGKNFVNAKNFLEKR